MKTENKKLPAGKWPGICLIILLSAISFFNTLQNKFVYDDEFFVVSNDAIKDLRNMTRFFTDSRTVGKGGNIEGDIYRPLTTLSYALDYAVWKLKPAGYHLTNLFFHTINGILVLLVAGLLFKERIQSLLAALFFVAHPVQTDAVTWVAGRGNVLFLFFYLLSLYFFIRSRTESSGSKPFYPVSIICFALSVLSKEMAVTLPVILLFYMYYFSPETAKNSREKMNQFLRQAKYAMPFFVVDILFVLVRSSVLGKVSQRAYWGSGLYQTMITMANVFVDYIKLLFLPIKLCADHVYPVSMSIFEPRVLISLSILILIFVAFFKTYRQYRIISFSIAWFFITMGPVSNIIPLKILLAERFLYLPSIGFCLFLSFVLAKYLPSKNAKLLLAFLIILFYTGRTSIRNNDWRDGYTFWSSVIKACPENAKAHNNLGTFYRESGLLEKSEEEFKTAIRLRPGYVTPHFNIAGLYISEKRYEESLVELESVLRIEPGYPNARRHYDEVYRYIKRTEVRGQKTEIRK